MRRTRTRTGGTPWEYDDQSNGRNGCIAACRFGPRPLTVDLVRPLSRRLAEVIGFGVSLRLAPDQRAAVRNGLRRVFRGHLELFAGAEPADAPGPAVLSGLALPICLSLEVASVTSEPVSYVVRRGR